MIEARGSKQSDCSLEQCKYDTDISKDSASETQMQSGSKPHMQAETMQERHRCNQDDCKQDTDAIRTSASKTQVQAEPVQERHRFGQEEGKKDTDSFRKRASKTQMQACNSAGTRVPR